MLVLTLHRKTSQQRQTRVPSQQNTFCARPSCPESCRSWTRSWPRNRNWPTRWTALKRRWPLCAITMRSTFFCCWCCKCGMYVYLSGQCDECIFDHGYSELFFRSQIYALHLWVSCSFYVTLHKVKQVRQHRCDPWYLNAPMNIVELVFG